MAETAGDVVPTGRPNARLRQTVADMARSLAVVLGIVAIILIITLRPQPEAVRVIDPAPVLAQAQAAGAGAIVYPSGLSAQWRPTSARWEVTDSSRPDPALHVGFVTPDDAYVQLGESATANADFIVEQTSKGRPVGVDGQWQLYDNGSGTKSLVQVRDGVTIVVSGTADWSVLADLAGRLTPLK